MSPGDGGATKPKSLIFAVPSVVRSTFSGLISRWTRPAESCRNCIPAQNCCAIRTASVSGSAPEARRCRRFPPLTYSSHKNSRCPPGIDAMGADYIGMGQQCRPHQTLSLKALQSPACRDHFRAERFDDVSPRA